MLVLVLEYKTEFCVDMNGSLVALEHGESKFAGAHGSAFGYSVRQKSLAQSNIPQRRMSAYAEARDAVAFIPAAQHHVSDDGSLEAGNVIAILSSGQAFA